MSSPHQPKRLYSATASSLLSSVFTSVYSLSEFPVLLPDFICSSVYSILTRHKIPYSLYTVNPDFSPNFDSINYELNRSPHSLLLCVSYFGQTNYIDTFLSLAVRYKLRLLVDNVHLVSSSFVHRNIQITSPLYILSSPRKFIDSTCGAQLAIFNDDIMYLSILHNSEPASLRSAIKSVPTLLARHLLFRSGIESLIRQYYRINSVHIPSTIHVSCSGGLITLHPALVFLQKFVVRYLCKHSCSYDFSHLLSSFAFLPSIHSSHTHWALPVVTHTVSQAQQVRSLLTGRRIPFYSWPDLLPEQPISQSSLDIISRLISINKILVDVTTIAKILSIASLHFN